MRVLLVNKFHYLKGGAETYNFALAEGLRSLGHEVAFFSMRHPDNLPCAQERYFVERREYNGGTSPLKKAADGLALVYSREARRRFQELCAEFRPDVVHMSNVHRQITLSILDAPYLREGRVPVVYTAHDYILCCPAYLAYGGAGLMGRGWGPGDVAAHPPSGYAGVLRLCAEGCAAGTCWFFGSTARRVAALARLARGRRECERDTRGRSAW